MAKTKKHNFLTSKVFIVGVIIIALILLASSIHILSTSKILNFSPTPTTIPTPTASQHVLIPCGLGKTCPAGYECQAVSACPNTKPGQVHCRALVMQCVKTH